MLVVMEDGEDFPALESALNNKTFRSLDVLQIYCLKVGAQVEYSLDGLLRRLSFINADGHNIDPAKHFEEQGLALHNRYARLGPDIPEPQYGSPIGHNRTQVLVPAGSLPAPGILQ